MATYFLRSKHLSRGRGARVTRAAAYRAGERIRDERTSEVYNYSDRRDVAYKEVVLPEDLADRADMAWTQNRSTLWNAAEHAGLRRNSRLARELLVLVPSELTPQQRAQLVRTFARELADKFRCAVDVALHEPRPGADRRNHHAHLLMTTREVTPDGLGARTTLELGGRERHLLGIARTPREEYLRVRERWAQVTNEALRAAGLTARVDHRSFARQGIDREPTPTIPEKVFYAERKSHRPSAAGEAIRARYRERVEARLKGPEELARVTQRQKQELRERALEDLERRRAQPKRIRWSSLTRAERNEIRREQYRTRRVIEKQDAAGEARRREVARQQYHKSMRENPEAVREQRRKWRKAHRDHINRHQREYRQAHHEELLRKQREYRRTHAQEANQRQREYRRVRAWQAYREAHGSPPTAQESVRDWLAYRESQGPRPTPEESVRNWLLYRAQQPSDASQDATERARGQALDQASDRSNDPASKPTPGRDHGLGR
jgi:hypothetical protein